MTKFLFNSFYLVALVYEVYHAQLCIFVGMNCLYIYAYVQ
jgi:hypothetical protein